MAEYSNEHIQGEWWKENAQMESVLNTTTFPSIGQGIVEHGEFTRLGGINDINRECIRRWRSAGQFSESLMNARLDDSSLSFPDTNPDGESGSSASV